MKTLLFVLGLTLSANVVCAQKMIALSEAYVITEMYKVRSGYLRTMIPKTIPGKQTVLKVVTFPEADSMYEEDGVSYARWKLSKLEQGDSIKVNVVLLIDRSDLKSSKRLKISNEENLEEYLKHEPLLQKNNKHLQEKAISLKGKDDVETTENIFDFVVEHMDYKNFVEHVRGAKKALRQAEGDCTEYSELMISLCRANSIPARIVLGKVLYDQDKVGLHNWVEVYLSEYGWVPFDPTFADEENVWTEFSKLMNCYVYYSNRRNDPVIKWRYFGGDHRKFNLKILRSWKNLLDKKYIDAVALYNSGENEKAKVIFANLIATTPVNYYYNRYQGLIYARQNDFENGLKFMQMAMKTAHFDDEKRNMIYSFANFYALKGDFDFALSHLEEAIRLGFDSLEYIEADDDLKSLRNLPRYYAIIAGIKK